eukprot:2218863-Heterocapsa_arctica.AAC.1
MLWGAYALGSMLFGACCLEHMLWGACCLEHALGSICSVGYVVLEARHLHHVDTRALDCDAVIQHTRHLPHIPLTGIVDA